MNFAIFYYNTLYSKMQRKDIKKPKNQRERTVIRIFGKSEIKIWKNKIINWKKLPDMCRAVLLFSDKIFSHINGAGDQDDQALDDILHVGINTKEGQSHKDQAQQDDA